MAAGEWVCTLIVEGSVIKQIAVIKDITIFACGEVGDEDRIGFYIDVIRRFVRALSIAVITEIACRIFNQISTRTGENCFVLLGGEMNGV